MWAIDAPGNADLGKVQEGDSRPGSMPAAYVSLTNWMTDTLLAALHGKEVEDGRQMVDRDV
jgi:hypothetical protein